MKMVRYSGMSGNSSQILGNALVFFLFACILVIAHIFCTRQFLGRKQNLSHGFTLRVRCHEFSRINTKKSVSIREIRGKMLLP